MNALSPHTPAQTYARNERASVTGRIAEGRAFAKAARLLDAVASGEADAVGRAHALTFNRILWTALQADLTAPGSPLLTAFRARLLSISLYVDRALLELRVSRKPAPLKALIDINRDIARGLLAVRGEA
jgi:flagellar protein FlaF